MPHETWAARSLDGPLALKPSDAARRYPRSNGRTARSRRIRRRAGTDGTERRQRNDAGAGSALGGLGLGPLLGLPAAFEEVGGDLLGRFGEPPPGCRRRGDSAPPRRRRCLLGGQLERRRDEAGPVVDVEVLDDVLQAVRRRRPASARRSRCCCRRARVDLTGGEQTPGQLGGGPRADGLVGLGEPLVAHARQRSGWPRSARCPGWRLGFSTTATGWPMATHPWTRVRVAPGLERRSDESRIVALVQRSVTRTRGSLSAGSQGRWWCGPRGLASSARRRTRLTTTSAATANATDTAASTLWTTLNPAWTRRPTDVPDAGTPDPDRPEGETAAAGLDLVTGGDGTSGAEVAPRAAYPGYLDPRVKSATQQGVAAMADITLEQFEKEARDVPRRQRRAQGGGEGVRVGRGRRQRRAVRREGAARREQEQLAEAKAWRAKRSTPASAGSPGPRSTAAGSCPRATSGVWHQLEGEYEMPDQGFFGIGLGMVAPTILAHATDTAKERVPQGAVPRRHRRLPAVQRARRRLRPRRPPDQGRARRRRVGPHRSEGLDLGRAVQRHRRDHLPHRPRPAQAQGPHRLRRRHAGAGRRGAAAAPDDRRGRRSTRCSSTRCGCPTTTGSATSTRAGPWRSPR